MVSALLVAVILLVVGAFVFLLAQDWFNPYIVAANPLGGGVPLKKA